MSQFLYDMKDLQVPRLLAQSNALLPLEMPLMSFEMLCDLVQSVTDLSITIKKHRNLLAPVNRLPQEILDKIFELIVVPLGRFTFTSSTQVPTAHRNVIDSIKNLSGVCVLWSHIVRQNPALYCHIVDGYDCAESSYSRSFLKRSGAKSLRLLAGFSPKPGSTTADTLRYHMHRLRELHVYSKDFCDMDKLSKDWFSRPAPILQCFTGHFQHGIESKDSLKLFDGEAPRLEALALRTHGTGMLPLQTFPKLAHIFFSGLACDFVVLVNFFRDSPNLETIYLEDIWFEADALGEPQPEAPAGSYAIMPRLRIFVCDSTAIIPILHILAGIIMPPGVRVVHLATVFDLREGPIVDLPPQFSLKATLEALGPFTELDIVDEDDVISIKAIGQSCRFSLRCEGDGDPDDEGAGPWLDPVLAALQSTHIVTMRVALDSYTSRLPDLFHRTPSLRKLVLRILHYNPEFDQSVLAQCSRLEYADENPMSHLTEVDLQIERWARPCIGDILSLFAAIARSRKDAMTASALRVFRVNVSPDQPGLDALEESVTELKVTKDDLWAPTTDGYEGGRPWKVRNKWWTLCTGDEHDGSEDSESSLNFEG